MEASKNYFPLPNKHRKIEKIPYAEILYLEAKINYTLIHLQSGKVKVSPRTMLFHLKNSLDESFLRIHRAFCVNKFYIESYDKNLSADILQIKGGVQLAVSRRRKIVLLNN